MFSDIVKKPILWGIIGIIAIVFGGVLLIRSRTIETSPSQEVIPTQVEALPTIDSSVLITLSPRADKKAVLLKIKNIPEDIVTIDYEITYEAKGGLPRGALGRIDLKSDRSVEREILLGTCSRNTCVYDEGVEKVTLTLRFNGATRKQFQKEFPL